MLNKALNKAHIQEREAQRYIRKGVFDKAIELEKSVLHNLEVLNLDLRCQNLPMLLPIRISRNLTSDSSGSPR